MNPYFLIAGNSWMTENRAHRATEISKTSGGTARRHAAGLSDLISVGAFRAVDSLEGSWKQVASLFRK